MAFGLKIDLKKILLIGTETTDDDQLKLFIQQANFNGLLWGALDSALALMFYFLFGNHYLGIVFANAAFLFVVTSIFFNSMGWTTLSRISTVSIGSLLVLKCSFYLGPQSLAHCALLLGGIFPFIYFKPTEIKALGICLSVPVIFYYILLYFDFNLGPRIHDQQRSTELIIQQIFYFVTFLGIVVNTFVAVKKLDQKAQELAESEENIRLLFRTLSHDIGNPLAVLNFLSIQAEKHKSLNGDQLTRFVRITNQITTIHSKLKQLSYLMTHKSLIETQSYSVVDLIEESLQVVVDDANLKALTFDKVNFESLRGLQVKVDKSIIIYQVFVNFLTNAIKFSENGNSIQILINKKDSKTCAVIIKDYGHGIQSNKLPHLFNFQINKSTKGTRGEVGTGLGLPIAKRFLALMGAELEVRSRTKEENPNLSGTEVCILLNIDPNAADDNTRTKAA